ncbi:MAG: hypothetical protein OEY32_11140 [Candidatus Krumholzibacteria bacterium]|jgi:hypothetical protein|nr:hypothetical protein [Candidatus Krumholzibacteria bacterium]MDH5270463.1 hypothetical protein [Candidatus Krumholzibacteria bacterium]
MRETAHRTAPAPDGEERPPIGGSWRVLYAVVIGNLVLLIILFYVFTRAFS